MCYWFTVTTVQNTRYFTQKCQSCHPQVQACVTFSLLWTQDLFKMAFNVKIKELVFNDNNMRMFYDSKKHKHQKIRAHIRHVALCVMHLRTLTSHSVYSVHHQSKSDDLAQGQSAAMCLCRRKAVQGRWYVCGQDVIDTESPYECPCWVCGSGLESSTEIFADHRWLCWDNVVS